MSDETRSHQLVSGSHALFFILLRYHHTTSLVVRTKRWLVVRKSHSARVGRVIIDGTLMQADEDDDERWVSTLEYDSAPETNLASWCSPGQTTRLRPWRWRMGRESHQTLLSSRESVLFDKDPWVAYIHSAETNIPRGSSKRVQTQ
jgi:hypothetical protein